MSYISYVRIFDQNISGIFYCENISSLELRTISYLTNVHFTLRPFYSLGRSSQNPLNMMLTGPQTQSEGFRGRNISVSCRKLKENCLVVHHVTSTLTQTEICPYSSLNP